MRKTVNYTTAQTITDYQSGFQYENGKLLFFPTSEGYVNHVGGSFNYVYNYTDHLGNIRLSYTKDLENPEVLRILEENHYYPFGLKHNNYNNDKKEFKKEETQTPLGLVEQLKIKTPPAMKGLDYQYKYNGKEWQDELGLNVTAMDFRMYDNALGRFSSIDKMADIMPSLSPYRFAFNNPVIWSDPSGLLEEKKDPHISLEEVVVSAKSRKEMPNYFPSYHLIGNRNMNNYSGSLADYNKQFNTNYFGDRAQDQWYNDNYYQPFRAEMIKSMHDATNTAAMIVAGALGTAFAAPIMAASPAVASFTSALVSNPAVQNVTLNVSSQMVVNGGQIRDINLVEAGMSSFGGLGATFFGEIHNISINSLSSGEIFEKQSTMKVAASATGGVVSYAFGEATDAYLKNSGTKGKIIGMYFKFLVETGSNAAPNLISE